MNIRDAEDAFLDAKATVEQFTAKFLATWYEPVTQMSAAMMWNKLPDEVKAELIKKNPASAAIVKKIAEDYSQGKIK